jgi:RNA polymerase sigma factor (TIGR02999 family)
MSEITRILNAIEHEDGDASFRLLPLVYDELRLIARRHMSHERSNHTLQPTALVHEAFLKLSGDSKSQWDSRGRFFAAASKAMRRILIDHARRKKARRHGGDRVPLPLDEELPELAHPFGSSDDILDLSDALDRLAAEDGIKAQLVELVFFAGLSIDEAAHCMGISRATANRYWTYSRAWLHDAMRGKTLPTPPEKTLDSL